MIESMVISIIVFFLSCAIVILCFGCIGLLTRIRDDELIKASIQNENTVLKQLNLIHKQLNLDKSLLIEELEEKLHEIKELSAVPSTEDSVETVSKFAEGED